MNFIEEIKLKIGEETYLKLDRLANGIFLQLKSNPYLSFKSMIEDILLKLVNECEVFENKGLRINPIDIINILYKCKLIKSCKTKEDYNKKTIGYNYVDEFDFFIPWTKKDTDINVLIQEYHERLKSFITEHTLLIEINSFNGNNYEIQFFLDNLFQELKYPFKAFIDSSFIISEHKKLGFTFESNLENAKSYFCSPSIGFSTSGSMLYCRWYSNYWLKSFLSFFKIGGFIYPGQIEFGGNIVTAIQAPNFPVFLGTYSKGNYIWDEDKKELLIKIPDGCLSRSFGNRSITKMWLDIRTFNDIRKFVVDNRPVFEILSNPWNTKVQNDILPILNIMSSTIYSIDIGAKILLTYCCLEHLFVPLSVKMNNKSYIVENINSLEPNLNGWFEELYNYRCAYAHKGYIKGNNKILDFIKISMLNVLILLRKKISQT